MRILPGVTKLWTILDCNNHTYWTCSLLWLVGNPCVSATLYINIPSSPCLNNTVDICRKQFLFVKTFLHTTAYLTTLRMQFSSMSWLMTHAWIFNSRYVYVFHIHKFFIHIFIIDIYSILNPTKHFITIYNSFINSRVNTLH